ncbi:hypothetical protein PI20285_07905 [Pediococcus inopinatus]|nr:hypothetical protein PI20285_07905 [Pediococcus inopinatus]
MEDKCSLFSYKYNKAVMYFKVNRLQKKIDQLDQSSRKILKIMNFSVLDYKNYQNKKPDYSNHTDYVWLR